MIKEWKLDNFKSIDKEQDLEFRPLTIFTGANSSGKSTILQSILLVTQTLQSPIASRSILLNGWFKKFGNYSDVVNCLVKAAKPSEPRIFILLTSLSLLTLDKLKASFRLYSLNRSLDSPASRGR